MQRFSTLQLQLWLGLRDVLNNVNSAVSDVNTRSDLVLRRNFPQQDMDTDQVHLAYRSKHFLSFSPSTLFTTAHISKRPLGSSTEQVGSQYV